MRWEDERYVRLYTRNSPEWLTMSWQARGLFGLIMREVDRAGILVVGRLGLKGVAVAVRAAYVEIESALNELLEDGCIRFDDERMVVFMPNFLEAQECAQSDRARKKASREKARAMFGVGSASAADKARHVTTRDSNTSQDVTYGHDSGQIVTNGHDRSQSVTLNRAEPTLPEPSRTATVTDGEAKRLTEPSTSKGTRLPADWRPKEETVAWVHDRGVDAAKVLEEFLLYWPTVSGHKGVRLNWDLVFRGRVRKLIEYGTAPRLPAAQREFKQERVPDAASAEQAKAFSDQILALTASKRPPPESVQ